MGKKELNSTQETASVSELLFNGKLKKSTTGLQIVGAEEYIKKQQSNPNFYLEMELFHSNYFKVNESLSKLTQ